MQDDSANSRRTQVEALVSTFRDPVADGFRSEAISLVASGRQEELREQCDELRLSAGTGERMRAAIGYMVLAASELADDRNEAAAYLYHFSGQAFRSVGMTSKAGTVYAASFDAGEAAVAEDQLAVQSVAALQAFDLRSIGRAINCFDDSGQFEKATAARRKLHNAHLAGERSKNNAVAAFFLAAWKWALDYSLSWRRLGILVALCAIVALAGPLWLGAPALVLAATATISVCIRRFP